MAQTTKPRVLIVEDESIIALDIMVMLRKNGYEVIDNVNNGTDALEIASNALPDLILMDINIDGPFDGIETARRIGSKQNIPIIFLSAYADDYTFERAFESGPYAYIIKPFEERELNLTIKTVLQKHALQNQIHQSEIRYRNLFEQSEDGLIILDDEGKILEMNAAARKTEQLIASGPVVRFPDFFPDSYRNLLLIQWAVFLNGENIKGKFSFTTIAGHKCHIEYKVQCNFLQGMHLATFQNTTAAVAARHKIETLARIPAEAPHPMLRINRDGEILYSNAVSWELVEFWRPVFGNRISDTLRERLPELSKKRRQLRSIAKVGAKVFSLLFVYVPRANYINIYGTDITRQKQSEKMTRYQTGLLEMIAKGEPLSIVIEQLATSLQDFIPESEIAAFVHSPLLNQVLPIPSATIRPDLLRVLHLRFNQHPDDLNQATELKHWANFFNNTQYSNPTDFNHWGIKRIKVIPISIKENSNIALFTVLFKQGLPHVNTENSLLEMAAKVIELALDREQALQRLYKQALVFENINDAIVITSHSGQVTEWNPAAEKIFGYSANEIIGKKLVEAGIFQRNARLEKLIRYSQGNYLPFNPKWTDEFKFVAKDQSQGIAETTVIKLNNQQENLEKDGTLIVMRDITLKRKTENALNRSEANLIALIENTDDVIFSIDRNFRLLSCNSAFKEIYYTYFGTVPETGHNFNPILENQQFANVKTALLEALEGENLRAEIGFILNGEQVFMETSINPIIRDEELITGLSLFSRNVTQRKQAENELKRTNFELDSFVYRASHDLRAPLRSILGLVDIMGMDNTKEQEKLYLSLVEKSVNRLDSFISDLTDYSRNNRLEIIAEPIDFSALIAEIVENLRYMENANKIEIRQEIVNASEFSSDKGRLAIVLQNLLSNAIKYQKQSGRFAEEVQAFCDININISPKQAIIVIRDNGTGIHPDYIERVFEMFFRATANSFGSGLGLYIAKQVVEKLGGNILLNSVYGEGTTFTITLPNFRGPSGLHKGNEGLIF